jgi:SAM-dependent methyltransferase
MSRALCRFCGSHLENTFVDLGNTPLSNSYLKKSDLSRPEPCYPLHAYVCSQCFLVQVEKFESPENIFSDYAYFSSYSDTWLKHCEAYAGEMVRRFGVGKPSKVVELASNDGCLLGCFKKRGIPVLGIEPAANVAKAARDGGIPTIAEFFGSDCAERLAAEDKCADLLIANNVLAHVPDLNDFVAGMKLLLAPNGVITIEFPHLLRLIEQRQFDTIYHEHFSYFSFSTAERVLEKHDLTVFDVEETDTHGGSLRVFARHEQNDGVAITGRVGEMRQLETDFGLQRMATYTSFGRKVAELKEELLTMLRRLRSEGKHIAGYGAPAKGNTLLNYCKIGPDLIEYTVDRSPHKQGLWLPGSRIPIMAPEKIAETRPDYVLVLPWNIKDEIMSQVGYIRGWGGRFIVPIPEPVVL